MAQILTLSKTRFKARAAHRRLAPRERGLRPAAVIACVMTALVIIGARLGVAPPDTASAAPGPIPAAVAADLIGDARVIDGDGLWIDGVEVRLQGVDAFELRQTCGDRACGVDARRALHRLVADKTVACQIVDQDRYERQVSRCSVDGRDLGSALVRDGHAVAYTRYSTAYVADEAAARAARAGAWAGEVTAPSDWRRTHT